MSQEKTDNGQEMKGNLTIGEYNTLVTKHGKLLHVHLDADEEENLPELDFWFRKPKMTEMAAMTKFVDSDPLQSGQIMFNSCLVHGDAKKVDDVDVFMSVSPFLEQLIKRRVATVKNY